MRLRDGTKTLPPKGCADFNIHWLDNTDQSLVIVDGGNRGTMKKPQKVRINLQQTEIADN